MKLYHGLDELPSDFRAGAVAIGNFDGVHIGHARIIERLIERAREFSGPAVVFTFDPHPVRLLRPEAAPPPLTWVNRKAFLLEELNVDIMVAYPTNNAFLALEPDEYFETIVCQRLRARAVVEGPNFFFGRHRSGNIDVLKQLCQQNGMTVDVVEPMRRGPEFVSSSRIRQAISDGDVAEANRMLTHPYRIRGMVTHGAARGTGIGFPTANVSAIDTLLPKLGVYAGVAHTREGRWPAAVNVGPNPTFGEKNLKVEAHLIGFSGSLYDEPLEVDFLRRLRDIHSFGSVDELKAQLSEDASAAKHEAAAFVDGPNSA